MRYLTFFCLLILTGCACFRPASIEEKTEYRTINVPVPRPGIEMKKDIIISDTFYFASPDFDLRLIRLPENDTDSGAIGLRIEAECLPDTLDVPVSVPFQTRTITRTVERRGMAWWGWLLVGASICLALIAALRR